MKKNAAYTVALIVILALFCLMGLAGCTGTGEENPGPAEESAAPRGETPPEPPPDTPATISFAGFSAGEQYGQTFQDMLALFSEAYPQITVIDESAGFGDYFTELAADIGSGSAPDVFELDLAHLADFSSAEAILPLDDMAARHGSDLGAYQGGLTRLCTVNKQLMALPYSYSAVVLIYNMDLFDAADVDYPVGDWVWNDTLLAAQKIAKPEEDIWGCYLGLEDFGDFYRRTIQNGGRLFNTDRTAFTLDAPQAVEALQWTQDLIWVYHVMPTTAEQAGRTAADLFAAGKLGMFLSDTGSFADLREHCGDTRWGIAPEPGNVKKASQVTCRVLCVNSAIETPDAAYTLAQFLTGDPGVQQLRLDAGWDLPSVSDPSVMKAYVDDTPPANKAAVLESTDYGFRPIVMEDLDTLTAILTPHLKAVRDNEEFPQEAMDAAQKEAERRINLPQE